MAHRKQADAADHIHQTFNGDTLDCWISYERCQGEPWPGQFVYVVENAEDWSEFEDVA